MTGRFAPPKRGWAARLWDWVRRKPKPKKWIFPVDDGAKELIESFDRLKKIADRD